MRRTEPLKVVGIIPARGGSKGIPQKNIRPLNGRPMLEYVIDAAERSGIFSHIIISSDDETILGIAERAGAFPAKRPEALAEDDVDHQEVAMHVILNLLAGAPEFPKILGPDFAVVMQPTSPLLKPRHLREAFQMFLLNYPKDALSCVAVTRSEVHPWKLFEIDPDGALAPWIDGGQHLNRARQLLPDYYRLTGAFYIFPVDKFRALKTYFLHPILPYFMKQWEAVDIDTPLDLDVAEMIMTRGEKNDAKRL